MKMRAVFRKGEGIESACYQAKITFLELLGQRDYMKKEIILACNPTFSIHKEHTCRNKAVNMEMIDQGLTPGM